jgi:cytochrome P450
MTDTYLQVALAHVIKVKRERSENDLKSTSVHNYATLFRHILDSDMPESELSNERLGKEAQVFLGGGTASTARTLGFISYFILADPSIRSRLEAELKEPMAKYPKVVATWATLEKLPFLQSLIKEGLR